MIPIDRQRIGQDLCPNHRRWLVRKALSVKDGITVHISKGEAETIASRETEREVRQRLNYGNL